MTKKLEEGQVRLDVKIDKVIDANNRQDVHLAKINEVLDINTRSLEHHVKRTDTLETHVTILEKSLIEHLAFVKGAIYIIGVSGGLVTLVLGILKTLGKL